MNLIYTFLSCLKGHKLKEEDSDISSFFWERQGEREGREAHHGGSFLSWERHTESFLPPGSLFLCDWAVVV